jgi:hypothetical protein
MWGIKKRGREIVLEKMHEKMFLIFLSPRKWCKKYTRPMHP